MCRTNATTGKKDWGFFYSLVYLTVFLCAFNLKRSWENITMARRNWGFYCSLVFLTVFLCTFNVKTGWANNGGDQGGRYCSKTAYAALKACQNELKDDYWIAVGNCYNLMDPEERKDCLKDVRGEWRDARPECREQLEARLDICEELGEGPYDPDFADLAFVDPASEPNPYFPLVPGNEWRYVGETDDGLEIIEVTVLEQIKMIEYPADSEREIACTVVQDVVWIDDEIVEDTFDWYAQDEYGNIWYMGEISRNYEDGELVDIEGSWKAGAESAKPGIVMYADPQEDDFYRQEFALGDAEDMGAFESIGDVEVIIEDENGVELFAFRDNILVTRDFTPIEPDVLEYKYYSPGIGLVLEEDPDSGEMVKLDYTNVTP